MYVLAPSVRACIDNGAVVFLDLRTDRYLSIDAARAPAIVMPARDPEGAAIGLVKEGLLQAAALALIGQTMPASEIEADLISATVVETPISTHFAALVVASCLRASRNLKARRLDKTFALLARSKARIVREPLLSVFEAVSIFEKVRPWYPRARVCLFDSIALVFFMIAMAHKPRLVLGVRAHPFSAHSWVEEDRVCVSDDADFCRSFTPIATV